MLLMYIVVYSSPSIHIHIAQCVPKCLLSSISCQLNLIWKFLPIIRELSRNNGQFTTYKLPSIIKQTIRKIYYRTLLIT